MTARTDNAARARVTVVGGLLARRHMRRSPDVPTYAATYARMQERWLELTSGMSKAERERVTALGRADAKRWGIIA